MNLLVEVDQNRQLVVNSHSKFLRLYINLTCYLSPAIFVHMVFEYVVLRGNKPNQRDERRANVCQN